MNCQISHNATFPSLSISSIPNDYSLQTLGLCQSPETSRNTPTQPHFPMQSFKQSKLKRVCSSKSFLSIAMDNSSPIWGLWSPYLSPQIIRNIPQDSQNLPYLFSNGYSQVLVGQISLAFPVVPSSLFLTPQGNTGRTLEVLGAPSMHTNNQKSF